ncbi:MAG: biotin/lipoyl-containing protein, partial [Planctomycetota bacterium]
MQIELKVPAVGESVTEIQVGQWVKAAGDKLAVDATVVILETDKTTVELPAPAAGTLTKILKKQGEKARVGEVLALIEAEAPAAAAPSHPAAPSGVAPVPSVVAPVPSGVAAAPSGVAPAPALPTATPSATPVVQAPLPAGAAQDVVKEGKDFQRVRLTRVEVKPRVMPAARRILSESDLNPETIAGTGPGGRVTKEDALRAATAPVPLTPAVATGAGSAPTVVPAAAPAVA